MTVFRTSADLRFSLIGNFTLALVVVGYPLSAVLSQLVGAESGNINYAFRIFVLVVSLVLGCLTIARRQYRFDVLIGAFLAIYTVRMVVDLTSLSLPDIESDIQFFLATVLAPTLALGGGHIWYDQRTLAKLIVWIGGAVSLLIVYVLNTRPDDILIETMGGRAALQFLNPISISYHGLFVAAAALVLFTTSQGWRQRLIWASIVILGGYLLIAGGSRGPMVAVVLAVGLTGFANLRSATSYSALFLILAVLLFVLGAPELLVERFQTAGNDASSIERFQTMRLSLELATNYPLVGYAYVEPATRSYPHNLLLESAMALGVIGAALMLLMQAMIVNGAWRLARHGERLLSFIAIVVLTNAWISGALWNSGLFFATLCVLRRVLNRLVPTTAHFSQQ